ncbi:MAG: MGMT family protein [Phycisphaeraceae bacterium]|nr:MGMT family protein [Phycisphaeraceae bacterium]
MSEKDLKPAILKGKVSPEMNFQQRIWALCARIPAGKVTTYGELARAAGSPSGARAVGMAMNRNPYAPAVPCHRVVASDGRLTGYAGGLAKKRAMLEAEGVSIDVSVPPPARWRVAALADHLWQAGRTADGKN